DADPVAVLEHLVADRHGRLGVVDVESAAADDADLAHLPAHQGRMAGGAAESSQDAVGRLHAANIFRAGLPAAENDAGIGVTFAVLVDPALGVLRMELDPPGGRPRTGVDALGQQLALGNGLAFGLRVEKRL